MACYYLVISSTHLSNGHFRSIKGVFRGPLRKTGTTLPGYAEKGKSIANALEDLKANFYCELCDKQYHKHQEFDNHINSYDHAHKQRLKELKQREFARNVASKSWKDEKKQEKALKRLHQLAELRKQPDCVSDDCPIYKTPRLNGPQQTFFKSKDDRIANSRCTVLCKGDSVTSSNITEEKQDILFGRDVLNNGRCCFVGNQTQLPFSNINNVSNRAGVSFCFSKKAPLKLDSSASVFNESTEDGNECSEDLNHKSKQMSVSFGHYAHLEEDATENSMMIDKEQTDKEENVQVYVTANAEIFEDDDHSRIIKEQAEIGQSDVQTHVLQSSEISCQENLKETKLEDFPRSDITSENPETKQCQEKSGILEKCSNKHTVADAILIEQLSQLLSQKCDEPEPSDNSNAEYHDTSNNTVEIQNEYPKVECKEPLNNSAQTIALSCLNVLSKDGNTNLQWPRELVLFTKTEPSISYACNPLYFDFKCSPKNKITKANERVAKNCEVHDQFKNSNEKNASGISVAMANGNDSQSSEGKREEHILKEISEKDYESHSNYSVTKELAQKTNLCNLHDNTTQISTHLDASQNCIFKESCHSGKRKRSFHGQLENRKSVHNRVNCEHNFCSKDSKSTSFKSLNLVNLNTIDNGKDINFYSSEINQCRNLNEIHQHAPSSLVESSSDYSKYSDSESDTNSLRYRRSSQLLSQSNASVHSDSTDSSTWSTCKHGNILRHKTSLRNTLKRQNCITEKLNNEVSSENDCMSHEFEKKQKYKSRNEKHKTCRKSSKNKLSESPLCSKYVRNVHRSKKRYRSSRNDQIPEGSQVKQINRCEDVNFTCNNLCDFSKERTVGSLKSVQKQGTFNKSETKETSYKCYSEKVVSLTDNGTENTSEKIVKHIIVNEKKTLIAELLLERGHSTKQGEKEIASREYSEGCSMKLKNHSQRYFSVQFPQSVHDTAALPNVSASHEGNLHYDTSQMQENRTRNGKLETSKSYEVAVSTNLNHCVFEDIIHIGRECRTLKTEHPVSLGEQSRQLINEVQPFMQNSDPTPFKLNCDLPSVRHSGGIDSPETKEHKRLGLHDVNMKSSPLEGNGKCYYDSTMQDFNVVNNHPRSYHKSASPPIAQPPITFSPDEVDKYRLLQLQAQQHMQKQLLSKHFKALPNNGPSVYSTAQAIQPVTVQQHPSITTIHHALMQRYAVTASMHSHVNHLPLTHLNHFPQSQFPPITLSSLTPTLFQPHPTFLAGHPLHLVSATAIHPAHLTIQAIPHTALVPAIFTPHPNVGVHPAIQLNPFIHPLFQGHDFHLHSGPNQSH
ncbi:zinc finger 804B [Pelobates cultripes]|uniref:Zinc finger 804B n=1 Tax=Pelobates cultripes TaxID=61616 RepID=A0AAD1RW44_PELCU|nr:zinc finger 804B [Pelobates cultripes]